jgi:hypothetical protein
MSNLGKLAVLVCGEFRTWSRASKYIFDYADSLSSDVDYYFASWETSLGNRITDENITEEFIKYNKNLIKYQIVQSIDWQHSSYYYQSYLAKLADIMKRRYEIDNNIIYDQVIEIRPDLYIERGTSSAIKLGDFECLLYIENNGTVEFPGATDLCYQSSSFGSDVITNRYYYQKSKIMDHIREYKHWELPFHNHQILSDYLYARRMKIIDTSRPTTQIVIRPTFPDGDLREYDINHLVKYDKEYKISINRK